jgi:hypothetical protein
MLYTERAFFLKHLNHSGTIYPVKLRNEIDESSIMRKIVKALKKESRNML